MQQATFSDYQQPQCQKSDIAFFELLKSISELTYCANSLSDLEIEQLQIGAKVLNGLIAKCRGKEYALAS
ncbi:MAG: hypothetical protein H0U57_06715 [Tatlockia sp.]|nr:hypothetical protein [Tatlockia sp.]